jgi:hypothetical protein
MLATGTASPAAAVAPKTERLLCEQLLRYHISQGPATGEEVATSQCQPLPPNVARISP